MKLKDAYSLEEKMTNLDSIFKSRDIALPTKIRLVKAMVFPVVMYGCESWTVKKAEHGRIDAFELWCWKRLLRVPWTAKRSNQSILKEIRPECNRSVFIPVAKKSNAKECSNYSIIVFISHTRNVMLRMLQAKLQQFVN